MPHDQPEFLIDEILPSNQVHLIFGPIVEDNTLLALQMVQEWRHARPVFGYASHPLPFCYVTCDHTIDHVEQFFGTVGITDPDKFPRVSLVSLAKAEERNIDSAHIRAREVRSGVRVLILDGLYSLCQTRLNDYRDASNFMVSAVRFCQEHRITIIGCVSTVKSREGEGYASPRERLHGSGALANVSATKILVEPNKPSRIVNPDRIVTILSSRVSRVLQYTKQNGVLVYRGDGIQQTDLDGWLANQASGSEVSAQDMRVLAEQLGLSPASLYRWLADQIELGTLAREKHGVYKVATAPAAN